MSPLNRVHSQKLKKIPASDAVWLASMRQSPLKIGAPDAGIPQPYYIVILDATAQTIRSFDLVETEPSVDDVAVALAQAMHSPQSSPLNEGGGGGEGGLIDAGVFEQPPIQRPQRILLDDEALANQLQPYFDELEIQVSFYTPLTPIDELLQTLELFMERGDQRTRLLDIPDVTPALVAALYEAAASFYRAGVWEHVFNDDVVKLRYPGPTGQDYFMCIMGNGGMEYGLAVYASLEDLNATLNIEDPEDPMAALEGVVAFSLTYGTRKEMQENDLKDMKKHRWALANKNAHPIFIKHDPLMGVVSPTADELKVLAAGLQVLPDFVVEKMQADVDEPVESVATYELSGIHAGTTAELSYPVEGIEFPEDDEDEEGAPDELATLFNLDDADLDIDKAFPGLRAFFLGDQPNGLVLDDDAESDDEDDKEDKDDKDEADNALNGKGDSPGPRPPPSKGTWKKRK